MILEVHMSSTQHPPTTELLIVRHGQTDWNLQRRIQGHTDIPLNETGKLEAKKLAETLRHSYFAACYTSDLVRAQETASILAQSHNLPVRTDTRLRERHFGPWEGCLRDELPAHPPSDQTDIESHQDLCLRAFQCFDDLRVQHPDEAVLIVTHGGFMSNILVEVGAFNCPTSYLKTRNTATILMEHANGKWKVKDIQGITQIAS